MKITDYVEKYAQISPNKPVILVPGKPELTYGRLFDFICRSRSFFQSHGYRSNDRIAVVVADCYEMACAFFAVSSTAVFVALDPDSSELEYKNYFYYFKVDALLVKEGQAVNARKAAADLGLPLILISSWEPNRPSDFQTNSDKTPSRTDCTQPVNDNDIAVLLSTSGTTARPKIISRTHSGICILGEHMAKLYQLTEDDRRLLVSPIRFFASMLGLWAIVSVGGSVVWINSIEPQSFLTILNDFCPTWFSCTPAVHQAIVEYFERNQMNPQGLSLRLISSSGAPLTVQLAEKMERIFHAPVISSYGMTETGIMTSTYRMPREKNGSVGRATDCEIGIIDGHGNRLASNSTGEIVVRGPLVLNYYEGDPHDDEQTFINGWFKTGDLGYLDEDSYLFIVGRVKELINRGGEKISPYEVEQIVLTHPEVAKAVVFPIPNIKLGEEIGLLIVLKPDAAASLRQLRDYLQGKISLAKIPSKMYIVAHIPTSSAGKVQRNFLHRQLDQILIIAASDTAAEYVAPRNDIEAKLVDLWRNFFPEKEIGISDHFLDLGGDSLAVARLNAEVERIWEVQIPLTDFYREPTIKWLAEFINQTGIENLTRPFLVRMQKGGQKPPLFMIHPLDGDVMVYQKFTSYLSYEHPVYGLRFDFKSFEVSHLVTVESMAAAYIRDIRSVQLEGPYFLIGYSLGGKIALEIARQLKNMGQEIAVLAMIDTILCRNKVKKSFYNRIKKPFVQLKQIGVLLKRAHQTEIIPEIYRIMKVKKIQKIITQLIYQLTPSGLKNRIGKLLSLKTFLGIITKQYQPKCIDCDLIYFLAGEKKNLYWEASLELLPKLVKNHQVITVGGTHSNVMADPKVVQMAEEFKKHLAAKGI